MPGQDKKAVCLYRWGYRGDPFKAAKRAACILIGEKPMHDIWNPWHGCVKCSEGCQHCYMYFLDRVWELTGLIYTAQSQGFITRFKNGVTAVTRSKAGKCSTSA